MMIEKNTKKRKSYSRVYDSKTKNRIYNDLQLSELNKANRIYLYEVDFSQKFNYCLCSICHNLMTRLKKSQPQPKTFKSNHKSQPRLTRSMKKSKSNNNNKVEDKVSKLVKSKLQKSIVSDDDEIEEIDNLEIEESESNDDTLMKILFKLVIKKKGKSSPAK